MGCDTVLSQILKDLKKYILPVFFILFDVVRHIRNNDWPHLLPQDVLLNLINNIFFELFF